MTVKLGRRRFLGVLGRSAVGIGALTATGLAGACSTTTGTQASSTTERAVTMPAGRRGRILLAYYSRAGENYYDGGRRTLSVGNTALLAGLIRDRIDCDVFEIEAADPYPASYDETVARNVAEQDADARPRISNPLPDLAGYRTVLLGSPVWNVRAPMIMSTFIESVGLDGKSVLPFVTYAVSGMGNVERDHREALPDSHVENGLAVRGETAAHADTEVERWLTTMSLT